MPYPMTHLYIAKKIMEMNLWSIKEKPQYFLGTLAPDAVQSRKVYNKKISHLCNSNEDWGYITKCDIWEKDVIEFLRNNSANENKDFLLGYCIHIFADICDNKYVLKPLRKKYADSYVEINKFLLDESRIIDLQLFQMNSYMNDIFNILKYSKTFNFMSIVNKNDMDLLIDNIVNVQYNENEIVNSNRNKILTLKNELEFIESTIEYIKEIIYKGKIKGVKIFNGWQRI